MIQSLVSDGELIPQLARTSLEEQSIDQSPPNLSRCNHIRETGNRFGILDDQPLISGMI
jgi:hypothetical protein